MHETLELREAMEAALGSGCFTLGFAPAICDGALLPERFCHVSNNDHGLKRILFDIEGSSDFTLDGGGTRLTFIGEVLPIRIGRSKNITIKNLAIDWLRPFFSQGEITGGGDGWITVFVDPARYPMRADRGRLVAFDGRGWQTDFLWNMLPFDPVRREVSSRHENWHLSRWHRATALEPGHFRIEAGFRESFPAGTPVVFMHGNRVAPAIFIEESEGVSVENVTIHHAPGMAVVAQLSRDVSLRGVRIVPSGDRLFSAWVDGIHLVDCEGTTSIQQCEVRGQFDDAVNIHGNFSRVCSIPGPRSLRIQTVHPQRFGRNAATVGSGLAVYRHATLERLLVTRVEDCRALNQEFCDIRLADPVPGDCGPLVVSRHNPDGAVDIRGCAFGANRGRGCLLNIEHKIIVEDCFFHVSGHAIESVPDANYWWEGPPVRDLTIRRNHFEKCGFGPCGSSLIKAGVELPDGADPRSGALREPAASTPQNREPTRPILGSITISDNTIRHDAGKVFDILFAEHLQIRDNQLRGAG